MAEFYAYRIIAGKTTYSKVPARLKEQVRTILIDEGFEYLVRE
ncbi:MAG: CD1375 family protein [Acutalibacteraceae bacterium]|jgi:hypothetical protein|nr:CD1375 family protein [Acutalibacteraceae bacterium]